MIMAKEVKKTAKGNTYIILQDSPSTFHLSIAIGDYVLYDFLNAPDSVETIHQHIIQLESELEGKINTI